MVTIPKWVIYDIVSTTLNWFYEELLYDAFPRKNGDIIWEDSRLDMLVWLIMEDDTQSCGSYGS